MLARIAQVQGQLDVAEVERSADLYARANELWHQEIIRGSGNDLLVASLERLRIPIFRIQLQAFHVADTIKRANADHRLIGDLVSRSRAVEAEVEMRRHIRDGLKAIEAMEDELFA